MRKTASRKGDEFMKKRVLALTLAACLLVPSLWGITAKADLSVNAPTEEKNIDGLIYRKYEYSDSHGEQKLFYGEYRPSEDSEYEFVVHNILGDDNAPILSTVSDIAADFTQKTGRKTVLATNGDYFYTTGNSVESLVMDGLVYNVGSFTYKHCFGFDNEGNSAIGRMTEYDKVLRVGTDEGAVIFDIDKVNAQPEEGELAVYTTAHNVPLTQACKYKVKTSAANLLQFPVFGTAGRMKTGEVVDDEALTLNSGEFALVVKGDNEISRWLYDNISYGTPCDLFYRPAGIFKDMPYVVGGYDILVNDGVVNTECHSDNSGDVPAPRTFFGIKEDGTMFLAVLDGRQSGYSVGCTVNEEALLAKQFGAKFALELDGGGSSTFLLDDGSGPKVLNKPSDGQQRRVSNAVLLVEKTAESDEPDPDPEKPDSSDSSQQGGSEEDSSVSSQGTTENKGCGSSAAVPGVLLTALAVCAAITIYKKKID